MTKKSERKDFVFKITVIGDGGVGKTSLIKKYTQGSFQKQYIKTLGAQFSKYDEKVNGDNCKLFFWDIAGQAEFSFMRPTFYKGSKAAIIVFSHAPAEEKSFDHIVDWHEDIKKYCGEIPVIIFANKVDLINEVNIDDSEIQKIVKEHNFIGVYRTSAKNGKGVTEAFQKIIRVLHNNYKSLI